MLAARQCVHLLLTIVVAGFGCGRHAPNPTPQSVDGARILGVLSFGRGIKDDDMFAINRAPLLDWVVVPNLPLPGTRIDSPRALGVVDSDYRPVLIKLTGTGHQNPPVLVEVLEVGRENVAARITSRPNAGYCVGTEWAFAFYLHGIGPPPIAGTVESRVGSSMHRTVVEPKYHVLRAEPVARVFRADVFQEPEPASVREVISFRGTRETTRVIALLLKRDAEGWRGGGGLTVGGQFSWLDGYARDRPADEWQLYLLAPPPC